MKMADTADAAASQPASSGKKKTVKPKKPKTSPSHPKVSEMVNEAITSLKERGGSSLQAIKKHIASSYKVDLEKLSPFIKKYLKNAVASGALVQTKGKGATGSFRLSAASGKPKEPASKAKKAPITPKKAKAAPAKKPAAKPKAAKKPVAAAKKAKPKAAKTPKKAKATKPKTPKPKKAKTPAKKAAAKKGKK